MEEKHLVSDLEKNKEWVKGVRVDWSSSYKFQVFTV